MGSGKETRCGDDTTATCLSPSSTYLVHSNNAKRCIDDAYGTNDAARTHTFSLHPPAPVTPSSSLMSTFSLSSSSSCRSQGSRIWSGVWQGASQGGCIPMRRLWNDVREGTFYPSPTLLSRLSSPEMRLMMLDRDQATGLAEHRVRMGDRLEER